MRRNDLSIDPGPSIEDFWREQHRIADELRAEKEFQRDRRVMRMTPEDVEHIRNAPKWRWNGGEKPNCWNVPACCLQCQERYDYDDGEPPFHGCLGDTERAQIRSI